MTEPRLIDCPPRRFVGLQTPFIHGRSPETNAPQLIGPLWSRFLQRCGEIAGRVDEGVLYGIIWGLPEDQRSHKHELWYMAGAEGRTEGDVVGPEGMAVREVAACTLAVVEHRGPIEEVRRTLDLVYADWLPASKYEHAEIVDLERYDDRFDGCSEDSVFDYGISVKPKA